MFNSHSFYCSFTSMQQLNGKEVAEDTFIQKGFVSFKGQERIQTVSYKKTHPNNN